MKTELKSIIKHLNTLDNLQKLETWFQWSRGNMPLVVAKNPLQDSSVLPVSAPVNPEDILY